MVELPPPPFLNFFGRREEPNPFSPEALDQSLSFLDLFLVQLRRAGYFFFFSKH